MTVHLYQIRVCPHCGLRYPLVKDEAAGERCPVCLAQTRLVLEGEIRPEPEAVQPGGASTVPLGVLLDNIRSAWNVGSILRSADGFEFRRAYLCGITPAATDPNVGKTALGAQESVASSAHKDAVKLIGQLKGEGVAIWALERAAASKPIHEVLQNLEAPKSLILVVGNEITGVDPGILQSADQIVHLPMRGRKGSFNVAVAFAVAAQMIRAQF